MEKLIDKMFCPKCGREDVELFKGLCKSCFLEEFKLINLPYKIEFTVCVKCGSTLKNGKWKDQILTEEELVYNAVIESVETPKNLENLKISVEILKTRGSIFECIVHASGRALGEVLDQDYAVEVKKNKTVCSDCSKYESGYYESVIQIRADRRVPTPEEIESIDKILIDRINKLSKKNRMAYVANRNVLKEGVDYYIGSYKAAKSLVDAVREVFGGIVKESPKIAGRDKSKGKDLYRIWISLRLAGFHKGDFIEYENKRGQVTGFNARKVIFKELNSPDTGSVIWKDYDSIKTIAKKEDVKAAILTAKTPKSVQILHPETYQPIDIPLHPGIGAVEVGMEVPVLELDGSFYILENHLQKTGEV
jgi:nonsense-mediated mRNA decay protein 3